MPTSIPTIVADIRGPIADKIAQRGRGGFMLRKRVPPNQYPTTARLRCRTAWASVLTSWRDLTDSERQLWRDYGQTVRTSSHQFTPATLDGHAAFAQLNYIRALASLPPHYSPPLTTPHPPPTALRADINTTGQVIVVTLDAPPPPDSICLLAAPRSLHSSKHVYDRSYRLRLIQAGPQFNQAGPDQTTPLLTLQGSYFALNSYGVVTQLDTLHLWLDWYTLAGLFISSQRLTAIVSSDLLFAHGFESIDPQDPFELQEFHNGKPAYFQDSTTLRMFRNASNTAWLIADAYSDDPDLAAYITFQPSPLGPYYRTAADLNPGAVIFPAP